MELTLVCPQNLWGPSVPREIPSFLLLSLRFGPQPLVSRCHQLFDSPPLRARNWELATKEAATGQGALSGATKTGVGAGGTSRPHLPASYPIPLPPFNSSGSRQDFLLGRERSTCHHRPMAEASVGLQIWGVGGQPVLSVV